MPKSVPGRGTTQAPSSIFETAARVARDIREDVYHPGQWLRQSDLAKHYGCTRLAMRQILEMLMSRGLVVHIPDRGYFVREFSSEEVNDFVEARVVLETAAVDSILDNAEPSAVDALQALAESFADAVEHQRYVEAGAVNLAFHDRLMALCANRVIARLVEDLRSQIPHAAYRRTANVFVMRQSVKDHFAIVAALRNKDRAALRKAMRRHAELMNFERSRQ